MIFVLLLLAVRGYRRSCPSVSVFHPPLPSSPQTLQLLYRIASPVNVVVIADRLLQQLDHSATDRRLRAAIIDNVADLAKRYPFSVI